jgi:hypothetical protein
MGISLTNVTSMDIETIQQFIKDLIAEYEKVLDYNAGNCCVKYCRSTLDRRMELISMERVSFLLF